MTQADYGAAEEAAGQGQFGDPLANLRLLTMDDVCVLLKVKKSWLYDTVEAGAIDAVKLGKQLRFQPSAISDYLARRARCNSPKSDLRGGSRGGPETGAGAPPPGER
ncbi:MAG: helix-turn-helix domain-containing protein [Streptosporangiales bacterium]|jgi:excisionase family DNA binding protein|nr:helix-turn-helix domain-containing protein [Streptosporangiales bacterium]